MADDTIDSNFAVSLWDLV